MLNQTVQNILFLWGGGSMKKNVDSIHCQHFNPFFLSFLWQIIHLKNIDVHTFWGGGGSEKVYFVHTHLNVDNNGWFLTSLIQTEPLRTVPVMMVPCPRMEKQWSTAKLSGPLASLCGLYANCFRQSINCSTPSASQLAACSNKNKNKTTFVKKLYTDLMSYHYLCYYKLESIDFGELLFINVDK